MNAHADKMAFSLPNQKKLNDLELEIQRLEQERENIRNEAKSAFVQQVKSALESLGMSPEELAKALLKKHKVTKGDKAGTIAPKYRNPENHAETWTGRGKKPVWIEKRLGAGESLDSLAI
ncbi:H-NS family nucleoid-associated regulatory protein [Undibacterium sp. SXout7W]|uniref:H-NS histone family protein n=1 Tax=Undibacterium sp. SXout7W TaxID=3413049 RepID=UPI003BF1946C